MESQWWTIPSSTPSPRSNGVFRTAEKASESTLCSFHTLYARRSQVFSNTQLSHNLMLAPEESLEGEATHRDTGRPMSSCLSTASQDPRLNTCSDPQGPLNPAAQSGAIRLLVVSPSSRAVGENLYLCHFTNSLLLHATFPVIAPFFSLFLKNLVSHFSVLPSSYLDFMCCPTQKLEVSRGWSHVTFVTSQSLA